MITESNIELIAPKDDGTLFVRGFDVSVRMPRRGSPPATEVPWGQSEEHDERFGIQGCVGAGFISAPKHQIKEGGY